jgi:hypothetical protein
MHHLNKKKKINEIKKKRIIVPFLPAVQLIKMHPATVALRERNIPSTPASIFDVHLVKLQS